MSDLVDRGSKVGRVTPWPIVRLGDVAKTSSGGTPKRTSPAYYGGGIPWVKSGELGDSTVYETSETISEAGLDESSAKIFPKGTLCVALYGATVGKLGILGVDAATNQAVCGIFLPSEIDTRFAFRFLESRRRQLMESAKGGAQPNISQEIIRDLKFPLPPIDEQRRVVAEIDKQFTRLDAGVAALRRTQANLKRYRAAVLKAACEGSLVPTAAEFTKDSNRKAKFEDGNTLLARILAERRKNWQGRGRFREPTPPDSTKLTPLPDDWTWASVEQLGEVQLGRQRSPQNVSKNYPTQYIRAANITERGIDVTDVLEMEFSPAERERFALHAGDIVLSEASGSPSQVGKPAIWRGELPLCCFQNTVLRLRPTIVRASYVLMVFQHFYANSVFAKVAGGVGINHLGAEKFSALPFPLPPLDEQSRIVAEVERRLSVVEELGGIVNNNLTRTKRLRESILGRAFSGQLVPSESDQVPEVLANAHEESRATDISASQLTAVIERPRKQMKTTVLETKGSSSSVGLRTSATQIRSASANPIADMKLLRLNLLDDFNSLRAFDFAFRNSSALVDSFSPICLVGLNGSGKSNLIEALSEILCYVELSLLPWNSIKAKHRSSRLRFLLEYEIAKSSHGKPCRIRIEKIETRTPLFFKIEGDKEAAISAPNDCLQVLPTRFVGYSSGLNETVSLAYLKTASLYSEEVLNRANDEERAAKELPPVPGARAIFVDYETNALITIANYLFQSQAKLTRFKDSLRIADVASFDIRFRPTFQGKRHVKLTGELKNYISGLRECANEVLTAGSRGGEIFRYTKSKTTANRLRNHFQNAEIFFSALYKLSLLNALALKGRDRRFFLREDSKEGQLERPPTVSREDKVFSIENVRLTLTRPKKTINYAAISDGEHQFLEVFGCVTLFRESGCMFLFDEPETHFNPQWRRRFVQLMAGISSTGRQELLISTHSPFVVSGCRGEHVFKFDRNGDHATCAKVPFETYGASYDFLLARLFSLKTMIAEQAVEEMRAILKSTSLKRLQDSLSEFGESFEKRFLFERIEELKKRGGRRKK